MTQAFAEGTVILVFVLGIVCVLSAMEWAWNAAPRVLDRVERWLWRTLRR